MYMLSTVQRITNKVVMRTIRKTSFVRGKFDILLEPESKKPTNYFLENRVEVRKRELIHKKSFTGIADIAERRISAERE